MDSELYHTRLECLRVVDHSFSVNGEKDFVLSEASDVTLIVEKGGKMFDREDEENKGPLQFSCDFLHVPGSTYVIGLCEIDDRKKN